MTNWKVILDARSQNSIDQKSASSNVSRASIDSALKTTPQRFLIAHLRTQRQSARRSLFVDPLEKFILNFWVKKVFLSNKKVATKKMRLMRAHPFVINFQFHKKPTIVESGFVLTTRPSLFFIVFDLFRVKKIAEKFSLLSFRCDVENDQSSEFLTVSRFLRNCFEYVRGIQLKANCVSYDQNLIDF